MNQVVFPLLVALLAARPTRACVYGNDCAPSFRYEGDGNGFLNGRFFRYFCYSEPAGSEVEQTLFNAAAQTCRDTPDCIGFERLYDPAGFTSLVCINSGLESTSFRLYEGGSVRSGSSGRSTWIKMPFPAPPPPSPPPPPRSPPATPSATIRASCFFNTGSTDLECPGATLSGSARKDADFVTLSEEAGQHGKLRYVFAEAASYRNVYSIFISAKFFFERRPGADSFGMRNGDLEGIGDNDPCVTMAGAVSTCVDVYNQKLYTTSPTGRSENTVSDSLLDQVKNEFHTFTFSVDYLGESIAPPFFGPITLPGRTIAYDPDATRAGVVDFLAWSGQESNVFRLQSFEAVAVFGEHVPPPPSPPAPPPPSPAPPRPPPSSPPLAPGIRQVFACDFAEGGGECAHATLHGNATREEPRGGGSGGAIVLANGTGGTGEAGEAGAQQGIVRLRLPIGTAAAVYRVNVDAHMSFTTASGGGGIGVRHGSEGDDAAGRDICAATSSIAACINVLGTGTEENDRFARVSQPTTSTSSFITEETVASEAGRTANVSLVIDYLGGAVTAFSYGAILGPTPMALLGDRIDNIDTSIIEFSAFSLPLSSGNNVFRLESFSVSVFGEGAPPGSPPSSPSPLPPPHPSPPSPRSPPDAPSLRSPPNQPPPSSASSSNIAAIVGGVVGGVLVTGGAISIIVLLLV